ncbi:hypothetical protein HQ865_22810 [Mucilaginibacter mali]|uniref:Uncharacterized protein n=1 Tax=Mucilaginibacter mali TaxID=2740462 RepID=A0A7D4TS17_9SPHI|nr:hypothetical protein [Mucilaginibacter mali]QKJ32474.1 hypothetical protein HQ865_22810 [Mucilaginibacter mali]
MDIGGNGKCRRGDKSPEPTPEQLREHRRLAEQVNYRIALNELAFYARGSTRQEGVLTDAQKGRAWTDHLGQGWVARTPISSPARNELAAILEVIREYEATHGNGDKEQQALDGIAEVRAARGEPSPDRLANFERNTAGTDAAMSPADIEPPSPQEHVIEIER